MCNIHNNWLIIISGSAFCEKNVDLASCGV